jgi:hypothetical protein
MFEIHLLSCGPSHSLASSELFPRGLFLAGHPESLNVASVATRQPSTALCCDRDRPDAAPVPGRTGLQCVFQCSGHRKSPTQLYTVCSAEESFGSRSDSCIFLNSTNVLGHHCLLMPGLRQPKFCVPGKSSNMSQQAEASSCLLWSDSRRWILPS